MTTETEPQPLTTYETDLHELGEQIVRASETVGERAAARALVDEGTIFARRNVRSALIADGPDGATARWEGLSRRKYTLGLNEKERLFLGLVLSLMGMGPITIAAVRGLDERRLCIIMRAILQLAENNTIAVGIRI
ncbi:hypothetical protein M2271_008300 [Streptomyces sp. LBL]|uniref:hypothetical protein n=1 Tax=Streptomyces sp. LBL TaxID=2940562 RepID=UPI00247369DC|nr:hypothetical protein [Streptomyces sp. LBL]MDH6630440.1 hypothetical protein [Streptomyces sp. LBL]